MNILLINRSDSLGGAAIASRRLMTALNDCGVNASMLVIDKQTTDPRIEAVGSKWRNRYNFMAERLGIYMRNGLNRDTLFKIDNASHGLDLSSHPWVHQADAIVLNWINQGMMSMKTLAKLAAMGKPIIWTMHDMWNCTGVCHHAYECRAYGTTCQSCPLLGSKGKDLSTRTQQAKAKLYNSARIHFVSVSNWLAECCRRSSLLKDAPMSVIGNPFPASEFMPHETQNKLGLAPDTRVIAMGAARLDDPVKGFDLMIEAMQYIATEMPELASKIHLLLYGGIRDKSLLDSIAVPHTYAGYVNDVRDIYSQAHIVLSTSRYESFGYTLVEGMSCGCVPVTTGAGGQVDIVKHMTNGYVTSGTDAQSIAQGIEWAVNSDLTRDQLHEWVTTHFDSSIIAQQYIELIKRLMG
ncbi:MAG: glycosyltransferase [Bacteroidales bacterium]|nr:glycosyltransferase [Candidatus Sodaliphilus fimicaballi]